MPTTVQDAVIAFLSDPAAYGAGTVTVERIDTHISIVWLVGTRAYKLKRAVHYDYVDFSTIEQRRLACEAEVTLNQRTAPTLYRRVLPVTCEAEVRWRSPAVVSRLIGWLRWSASTRTRCSTASPIGIGWTFR